MPPRAHPRAMGDSGKSTSPPSSGRWDALLFLSCKRDRLCPGKCPVRCQESQRGAPRPCTGKPRRGDTKQCVSPAVRSLSCLRVREKGLLCPSRATPLLSSSCYFLLLQWDCLATSITPPRCVTEKILSSILMAFLRFTRPLVDLTTTITTIKASVKISSPA